MKTLSKPMLFQGAGFLLRQFVKIRFHRAPIILGGAPRSGTTLLLAVLGSHPSIYSIDYETASLHPRVRPLKLLKFLLLESKTELRRIPKEKTRFCEKTPGNVLQGSEIIDLFHGEVKIINIFRDGRDVVTSRHPLRPEEFWVKIETWCHYVERGLALDHFPQVMSIRYEDLVAEPEETLKRVCSFLGEEFDGRMLTHHEHTNVTSNLAWFGSGDRIKMESPEEVGAARVCRPGARVHG
jgi:hypothetical protein